MYHCTTWWCDIIIRSTPKTIRNVFSHFFLHYVSATSTIIALSFELIGSLDCLFPFWLPWVIILVLFYTFNNSFSSWPELLYQCEAWCTNIHMKMNLIFSNLTFIFDLNYFLWKLKTSKRQGVSFLLETEHKVFQFKTKPIPQMPVQDTKSSLKIHVANAQLSVALATGWS